MNIINRKQIYTVLLLLPYFFAVTGMLVLDSGDKKMIPLFLISIIVSILVFKKETIVNNIQSPFVWLIGISCIYIVFSYYYHGASSREMRAMIGSTLFLIFFPYKLLTTKRISWVVFFGGLLTCANSLYFNLYIGSVRDTGYINPIPYATTSALLAIIAFSLLINAASIRSKLLSLASFILYLPPIIISDSRGVWVALFISLILILIISIKNSPSIKSTLFFIITLFVLLPSVFFLFKDNISQRYNSTIVEIKRIQHGHYNTSIGLRLQMWTIAPEIFIQSPLIGVGEKNKIILLEKIKDKNVYKTFYHYASSHYHNQLIEKMVKSGVIGLLLTISLLFYPIFIMGNLPIHEKCIVIGLTSLFFIAGLTDVPFSHAQPLILYLLFMVPICSRCKRVTND